ncbi:19856_t:CDS:1, partial [Gigaspora rosea]
SEPKNKNSREGEEAHAHNIRSPSRRNSCSTKTWTDHITLHTIGSNRSKTSIKNISVHSKKWNPKHEEVSDSTNEEIVETLEIKLMLNQILNQLNRIESHYHVPDKGRRLPNAPKSCHRRQ